MEVFSDTGIDPAFFANRSMDDNEILPWDMIDCGVSKSFLLRERHKSQEAATTPSCKEKCSGCGANGLVDPEMCRWCPGHKESEAEYLGQNISAKDIAPRDDDSKRDERGAGAAKNPSAKPVKSVKVRFSESGALTYISHLDINRAVMRGLVKSKLPLYYTEGFNPIPKLTFASPLSTGCGGENEYFRIKLMKDVPDSEIFEKLSASMPDGIEILEVYSSDSDFKTIAWAENVIDFKCASPENWHDMLTEEFSGEVTVLKKTKRTEKEVDISPWFKDISFEKTEDGVRIKVFTCADNTNYLNPEYIAKVALRVLSEGKDGYHTITRKQFYTADGKVFR